MGGGIKPQSITFLDENGIAENVTKDTGTAAGGTPYAVTYSMGWGVSQESDPSYHSVTPESDNLWD